MDFFKNKVNVILTFVACTLLGAAGFLGYKFLFTQDKTIVPDFSDKTSVDVNAWCASLETNPCTITSDYSNTVPEGKVIYQSINGDGELTDSISFIISLGKQMEVAAPTYDQSTSKDAIVAWASENNITNVNYVEEYSDTVSSGNIIKIDCDAVITNSSTVTVYVSKGVQESENPTGAITVKANQFVGFTKSEFESKVKALGLTASYSSNRDDYSSTVTKGNVVWHGSGEYIKDEEIHYGLSLGNDENAIKVEQGTYVGKSLDDFKAAVEKLGTKGLVATHNEEWDDYSDKIEKGYIVRHGYGNYDDGENIRYGVSLGSESSSIKVTANEYVGKTLDEFKTLVSKLGEKGLKPEHDSSWDDYSSTIAKDSIIKHGSGTYDEEEVIHYGLSLGSKDSTSTEIVIKEGAYVDKTYSEFETAVKALGLGTTHRSEWDKSTSDSSKVGKISKNGYGTYEKGENCSYGLYVSDSNAEIEIAKGTYVGKTYSEFEASVAALGLGTNHRSDWDSKTSDSSLVGKVCKNGNGTYTKGEKCSYGLYLSDSSSSSSKIAVSENTYIGLLRADFKTKMSDLGLGSDHNTSWDDYSDSIGEGKVIKYETGSFEKGTTIRYGLSLGKKQSSTPEPVVQTITVNAGAYNGKTEAQIDAAIKALGLSPNHDTSKDAYSSSIAKGSVVYHDSGLYTAGSSVSYGLSLGVQSLYINSKTFYNTNYMYNSYSEMETKMKSVLTGFTNIKYVKTESADVAVGKIDYIKVNGSTSYDPGYVAANTSIEIGIVNSLKAS